jgi:uncharacterized SAM-binding protein YcdF (DUF218 family)
VCDYLHRVPKDRMIVTTLLVLLAIAIGLTLSKRPRGGWTVGLLTLILLFATGCGPVPDWLVKNLQTGYPATTAVPWGERSAIVLLGAGTEKVADDHSLEPGEFANARLLKALELYLSCKRHGAYCLILVSGGDAQNHGASEASVYGSELRSLGVDPADLVLEGHSLNTWQNAQFSAALLSAQHLDTEYLVSSGIHLRRAVLYFTHFGIHATAVRGDYVRAVSSPIPLSYNLLLTDVAWHEYVGVLRYYVYEKLGWNAASARPGQS